MDQNMMILVVAVAVIVIAAIAFLLFKKRRTERLRNQFGPEYDRTVETAGDQSRAERELREREKRVESFNIVRLSSADRLRFSKAWTTIQSRFVDEPTLAVTEADELVKELMRTRGYPLGDFEQRAADISVHHPRVVSNYRIARDIALKNRKGEASTEELRQSLVAYRELFIDLLEEEPSGKQPIVEEKYDDSSRKRTYHH